MKVVAFNGSARKDGNTAILIRELFKELEGEGIETEMVQLAGKTMHGCLACYKCAAKKDRRCAVDKDYVNTCIEKMLEADGIILASPVYFTDVSAEMKALIDRAGVVARVNGNMFARKVGAAVVAVRRGGQIHTFDTINHFFLIGEMIIPGSDYWNFGFGREKGEVEQDKEGLETIRLLGKNMAWLMKKLAR
jgi:multimeric flavodoxin WrbA